MVLVVVLVAVLSAVSVVATAVMKVAAVVATAVAATTTTMSEGVLVVRDGCGSTNIRLLCS